MRTNLCRAVLALSVVFAVTAPAAAQSVIRGKVVDAAGKPVEGATVNIEATEANRKAETKTNRNGEFLQVGLASGRYNVTVTKDKLKAVQPATVSQGTPVELSFQLSPTSGMTPEQVKAQQEMQALAQGAVEAMRAGRDDEAIQKFNEILVKQPACSDCSITSASRIEEAAVRGGRRGVPEGHCPRARLSRCVHRPGERVQRAEEVRPGAAGQRQGLRTRGRRRSWRGRGRPLQPGCHSLERR